VQLDPLFPQWLEFLQFFLVCGVEGGLLLLRYLVTFFLDGLGLHGTRLASEFFEAITSELKVGV